MNQGTEAIGPKIIKTVQNEESKFKAPKITTLNAVSVVVAVILVIAALIITARLLESTDRTEAVHTRYDECATAADELMIASDFLTTQARMFVVTGDRTYMDAYCDELFNSKRRETSVDILATEGDDARAAAELTEALTESNNLAAIEFYAMRLTADALGISPLPQGVSTANISPEDDGLSPTEKRELASEMVLGDKYREMKALIVRDVDDCTAELVQGLEQKVIVNEKATDRLLFALITIVILLMGLVAFATGSNYFLVIKPMKVHAKNLENVEPFTPIGCHEIRRVTIAYNRLYEEVRQKTADLQHEAETDALTGALNRGSFDKLITRFGTNIALVIADVDYFKQVNDTYGHEVGDEILKKVASSTRSRFRSSDYVCRIGGDEFAVIVTNVKPENKNVIASKLTLISEDLANTSDDLPEITLSFGVAFGSTLGSNGNLYHNADKALYDSKHNGRNSITFSD